MCPDHKTHRYLNKIVTGREFQSVNEWIDAPVRWLGPRHRILRHSPLDIVLKYGFTDESIAGITHLATDFAYTKYKKDLRRKLGHDGYSAWKTMWEAIRKTQSGK